MRVAEKNAMAIINGGIYAQLGEFKNRHGERFVLYRFAAGESELRKAIQKRWGKTTFVTGDELDWEIGWEYVKGHGLVKRFELTAAERQDLDAAIERGERIHRV